MEREYVIEPLLVNDLEDNQVYVQPSKSRYPLIIAEKILLATFIMAIGSYMIFEYSIGNVATSAQIFLSVIQLGLALLFICMLFDIIPSPCRLVFR